MKLILRILINAFAIWLAAMLLEGFNFSGSIVNLIIVAIIFGLVNALIRPIVKLLTLPITLITLGLFTLVINMLMLMLTVWLSGSLSLTGGFFELNIRNSRGHNQHISIFELLHYFFLHLLSGFNLPELHLG